MPKPGPSKRVCQCVLTQVLWWGCRRPCPTVHVLVWDAMCECVFVCVCVLVCSSVCVHALVSSVHALLCLVCVCARLCTDGHVPGTSYVFPCAPGTGLVCLARWSDSQLAI